MANLHRGEIDAQFDGRTYTLCLTLGALAELESQFGSQNLGQLTERFSKGVLSADDLIKIIGAGLRGAGHAVDNSDLKNMQVERGAVGFLEIATQLLNVTFGAKM